MMNPAKFIVFDSLLCAARNIRCASQRNQCIPTACRQVSHGGTLLGCGKLLPERLLLQEQLFGSVVIPNLTLAIVATWLRWSSPRSTPRLLHSSLGRAERSQSGSSFGSLGGALVSHQQAASVDAGSDHDSCVHRRSAREPGSCSSSVVSLLPRNSQLSAAPTAR